MTRGSVKPHFPFSNAGKEECIFDEKIEKRGRETGQKKAGKIFLRVFVTLKKREDFYWSKERANERKQNVTICMGNT